MAILVKVYIVRHGETTSNKDGTIQGHLDTALNQEGLRQATLLAQRLKSDSFHVAYTSDLQRAKNTAEAILKHHPGVDLHEREDMRERFMGTLQGSKLPSMVRKAIMRDDTTIETTEKLGSRALAWWEGTILPLARDSKTKLYNGTEPATLNVLVASHGGWISTFFNAAVAQGLIALSPGVTFTRCWNTSVSIVEVDETLKGSVTAYSDISHLLRKDVVNTNVDEVEVDSAPSGGESGGNAAAVSSQNGLA